MARINKAVKAQVLCVNSQPSGHDTLTLILEGYDYSVISAHSAEEAISLAQTQHFDLYILDRLLPDGSEYELCQQIRNFDSHTPLIFYSTRDDQSGEERARAAGGQTHIRKPTYPKMLMQRISQVLGTSPNMDRWVIWITFSSSLTNETETNVVMSQASSNNEVPD